MPQHPMFQIYKRNYLNQVTGFSFQQLSRMSTGKRRLTRSFVDLCCYRLGRPEGELFLPEATAAGVGSQAQEKQ
jgi:hypothetical protein